MTTAKWTDVSTWARRNCWRYDILRPPQFTPTASTNRKAEAIKFAKQNGLSARTIYDGSRPYAKVTDPATCDVTYARRLVDAVFWHSRRTQHAYEVANALISMFSNGAL